MPAGGADLPTRPPPTVPAWPDAELLADHDVVLARPRLEDAPAALAMQADDRLWIDVPRAWRVTTLEAQQDDIRRFLAHWRDHGFGYWLAWTAAGGTVDAAEGDRKHPEPARSSGPVGIGGLRWLWWQGAWVLNVYVRIAVAGQGRGLAAALLTTAVDRLDADLADPTQVVVRTRDANAEMIALARRLGMADIGEEEREMGRYRVLSRHIGGRR